MRGDESVRARLDAATRIRHGETDAPWLALCSGAIDPRDYLYHLVAIYGFQAPLESALALTPRLGMQIDLRERARTSWVVQDLLLLGLGPAKIARLPQCGAIMPFRDTIEALGWLYVGELVSRHHDELLAHVAFSLPTAPTAYLSAPRIDPQTLDAALERIATSDDIVERVIDAATEAITCHVEWFGDHVRLSSPGLLRFG